MDYYKNNQIVSLLDTIVLTNESELIGVVDYINTKHLYFVDFTGIHDENLINSAIHWCMDRPDKRFSVYIQWKFRNLIKLPDTKLIHFNGIKDSNFDYKELFKNN